MNEQWTRRQFVGTVGAAGAMELLPVPAWAWPQQRDEHGRTMRSQASSPEITAGKLIPLLESNVARPLRYSAISGGYAIENGKQLFNRPLYGPNIPFRVDGGDLPEFSLYLPGHGGNLRLGVQGSDGEAKWLQACESVRMQYVGGRLEYEIRDAVLGSGKLVVEALTQGAGLWVKVAGVGLPEGARLVWAFGGASGRKGQRNGDIGFPAVRRSNCSTASRASCSAGCATAVKEGLRKLANSISSIPMNPISSSPILLSSNA